MLDKNEGLAVTGLIGIAIVSMFVLGTDSKEIVLAISAGMVVFLKGKR